MNPIGTCKAINLIILCSVLAVADTGHANATCQQWQLVNPQPVEQDLHATAYGNGVYVAVGAGGVTLSSSDQLVWQKLPSVTQLDLNAVIWSGSQFVAAGDRGTILISPDGLAWTAVYGGQHDLYGLASDGALLVAVGESGRIMTSNNGSIWASKVSAVNVDLTTVVWSGTLFVAAGNDGVLLTSPDGEGWSSQDAGTSSDLSSLTSNGELVVMVNQGGQVASSVDGISWSSWSTVDERLRRIKWCGDHFIAVGGRSEYVGYLGLSDDGFDWRRSETWDQLWELDDIACGSEAAVAVGRGGVIVESYDRGTHWHAVSSITEIPFRALASNGSRILVVGGYLEHASEIPVTAVVSEDGADWQAATPFYQMSYYDIVFGNGLWVAVGSYSDPFNPVGRVLYSPHASSWSWENTVTDDGHSPQRLLGVTWDGNRFVVVGDDGVIGISEDGTIWDFQYSLTSRSLYSVTAGSNMIVAVGEGTIVTSSNSVDWTTIDVSQNLWSVTRGNGQLIAVGDSGTVLASTNGSSWSLQSSGVSQNLYDVTWTGERFLAAGAGGVVISSDNGWQWQEEETGLAGALYAIAEIGEQIIAVGDRGLIQRAACREPDEPPIAGFSWRPVRVEVGRQISFVDLTTGDATSWEWEFGDGTGDTVQSPIHTYAYPGNYPVTLTAGNQNGTTTTSRYVHAVNPCGPVAAPELTVPVYANSGVQYTINWTETLSGGRYGHYEIHESTDPQFTEANTRVMTAGSGIGRLTLASSWTRSRVLYYRILAKRQCFDGSYPSAWSEARQIVILPSPQDASVNALVVPAVAHTSGLEQTEWLSDLVLHNPNPGQASAFVSLIGGAHSAFQEMTIAGGQSQQITDVVGLLMPGVETAASLLVDSDLPLQVSSRTYNNQPDGTYGQQISGLPLTSAIGPGQEVALIQLTSNDDFRTNLGIANLSSEPIEVTAELFQSDGTFLGEHTYYVPALAHQMESDILGQLSADAVEDAFAIVSTSTDEAELFAYSSVVDNHSGDPVAQIATIAQSPEPGPADARVSTWDIWAEADTFYELIWAAGLYVAVSPNQVAWSLDTVTWEGVSTSNEINLYGIEWNGSSFLAVGCSGTMTSAEGERWTAHQQPGELCLFDVVWTGDRWLALSNVSPDTDVVTSTDGISWETVTRLEAVELTDLVWTGDQVVAVGRFGDIYTSPNGMVWEARDSGTDQRLTEIVWTGSLLAAIAPGGVVVTSPDGLTWTAHQVSGQPSAIVWAEDRFVISDSMSAYGATPGFLFSRDGTEWSKLDESAARTILTLAWDGSQVIGIGWDRQLTSLRFNGLGVMVPAVAHLDGANGSLWRTDLELFNGSETEQTLSLELLLRDQSGTPAAEAATIELAPGTATRIEDVLDSLFSTSGAGALWVTFEEQGIIVTSRTYTDSEQGTYGQQVPAYLTSQALLPLDRGRLIQLAHSPDGETGFRTNLGLVNDCSRWMSVRVDLYGDNGDLLGSRSYTLQPSTVRQINNVFAEVTTSPVSNGFAVVSSTTPGCRLYTYASVVENRSNDPIFIPVGLSSR
jgi:PKD repeat protein